ncbi:NAD-dependent epimerase/dehydratase family protein [Alteromonas pelagimontana]|uniref:NAD-dependent epimerase/dehydratase family protein n=1 Tax=Alteromonas pelagimontana TaxID=1858656 RepID=A0A6M4MBK3_9ALTE|nr:NAD-dependent epimerase/dehydratase family protein [Alteromonas pelagimontana]QJR80584.1 NAD-dependent epimerase/dehydratase family protein [Alteromonas pelagimontana]
MKDRILITGGAGFVGSHLADQLLQAGYNVRVLDNLTPQVHETNDWPDYLDKRVEKLRGDVQDMDAVTQALEDVDAVFHLAAAVGVGQSMYEICHYTQTNNVGTAVLLEAIAKKPVKKLVVASSMSLYGEGAYLDESGNTVFPHERSPEELKKSNWDPRLNGQVLRPIATDENKLPAPSSVYALSKYDQEKLCLMVGEAYNIPTTALRFFNIYGPRQALSNPYTGVLAIFSSRYLNDRAPVIFEDGQQRRDFVSVHDIAQACVKALESDAANGQVFNIGSGNNYSILELAEKVAAQLGKSHLTPEVCGEYRVGDIRHCFGDISKAEKLLGYRPQVSLEQGLDELAQWLQKQSANDRVDSMRSELSSRGLSR